jgi:hypothetical protein
MATGTYKIQTDKGMAMVSQNPDGNVTVTSNGKTWTGAQDEFNAQFAKSVKNSTGTNGSITKYGQDASGFTGDNKTASFSTPTKLPAGTTSFDTSAGKDLTKIDYGSYGDESGFTKAINEANAKAAKAEADRKATMEQAVKLQADTKKATDAVAAGQTQAAVNAEMGRDATQTGTDATATTISAGDSASADYQNALASAIKNKPAVSDDEKATIVSEEEAKAMAVQNEIDGLKKSQMEYTLNQQKLMDERAGKNMEEAKANAEYEANKLKLKQEQLDLQVEQARKKAEKDTYNAERVASLNMMKLGLVGSGSAVATFQAIATDGISRLTEIQAEYSNKSAMLALDAKREADKLVYDLNKISDNYVEKRLASNKELMDFITKSQRSTTENKLKQEENIKKRVQEAKKEKQDDQEWALKLYRERADQAILAEDRIQKKADRLKADGKDKIKMLTDTGAWKDLTPEERAKIETDAGYPIGSSLKIINQLNGEDVQKLIDKQDLKGYFPSGKAMDTLNTRVNQLIDSGKARSVAVNIAFGELAASDPNLKAAMAKANALKSGGSSSAEWKNMGEPFTTSEGVFVNQVDKAGNVRQQLVSTDKDVYANTQAVMDKKFNLPSAKTNYKDVETDIDGVTYVIRNIMDENMNVVRTENLGKKGATPRATTGSNLEALMGKKQ